MGTKGTRDMRSGDKSKDSAVVKLDMTPQRGDIRLVRTEQDQSSDAEEDGGVPPLNPAIQGHLGRQLRTMYKTLVDEPVPDRFKKLLDELKAKEDSKPDHQE